MPSVSDISELLDESLKMKAFSHPNILNLIGVCVDGGPAPYVVMPYMERGSLLHFLKKERPHFTLAEGADSELVSPIPNLHFMTPHFHPMSGSSPRPPSSSVFPWNYQAFSTTMLTKYTSSHNAKNWGKNPSILYSFILATILLCSSRHASYTG